MPALRRLASRAPEQGIAAGQIDADRRALRIEAAAGRATDSARTASTHGTRRRTRLMFPGTNRSSRSTVWSYYSSMATVAKRGRRARGRAARANRYPPQPAEVPQRDSGAPEKRRAPPPPSPLSLSSYSTLIAIPSNRVGSQSMFWGRTHVDPSGVDSFRTSTAFTSTSIIPACSNWGVSPTRGGTHAGRHGHPTVST